MTPSEPTLSEPLLLKIEEVSARTGYPVETLRHWRKTGRGPRFERIGKRLACRREDLDAWLREQFSETA